MYTEFIIIYVLLAVVLGVSIVNLIFTLKGKTNSSVSRGPSASKINQQPFMQSQIDTPVKSSASPSYNPNSGNSVVFCLNCATQYSASDKCCPNCGTPRS